MDRNTSATQSWCCLSKLRVDSPAEALLFVDMTHSSQIGYSYSKYTLFYQVVVVAEMMCRLGYLLPYSKLRRSALLAAMPI